MTDGTSEEGVASAETLGTDSSGCVDAEAVAVSVAGSVLVLVVLVVVVVVVVEVEVVVGVADVCGGNINMDGTADGLFAGGGGGGRRDSNVLVRRGVKEKRAGVERRVSRAA